MRIQYVPILSVVGVATAWDTLVRVLAPAPRRYVFTIWEMLQALPALVSHGLIGALAITVARAVLGFALACAIGVSAGLLIGRSRWLSSACAPLINFFRPLPSSALIPVVMTLPMFGLSERSFYVVIVFGGVWAVLFNTISGVYSVGRTARSVSRMLPFSRWQKLLIFTLPEAAPEIYTGMQISLGICLILAITAELLIGGQGVGSMISTENSGANYRGVHALILVIALTGWALNSGFALVGRFHPWLRYLGADAVHD